MNITSEERYRSFKNNQFCEQKYVILMLFQTSQMFYTAFFRHFSFA